MKTAKKSERQIARSERLRKRAERLLTKSPHEISAMPVGDVRKLVHELQVHQVELEMQNEELRRVQLELENSRDRFAELYDFAPVGYLTLAAEGVVHEANLTAARLLGVSREQLLAKKLTAFITREFQDAFYLYRQKLFTSWTKQVCELQMRRKDGSTFFAGLESIAMRDGHPKLQEWLLAFSDFTERKQAETALLKSEGEMADFFNSSPLGLLWIGPDGRILRANQAQLELLGYPAGEVFGQPVSQFHADPDVLTDLLRRLVKGETVQNYRVRIRQKSGNLSHAMVDANGLWEKRRLVHLRWFVRDITRRVELEREILSISDREQQRMGQDLHDDLCQQLAGIEFISQTLAAHLADHAIAEAGQAKEIGQLARRAMKQTREIARGLSPVSLEADGLMIAIRELAARTRKIFRLDCRFQCETPVIVPDQTVSIHLYRIAQEAVNNAIKHGKARRIDIGLAANGNKVVLGVTDDGLGLTNKKKGKRPGMGLRIMQYRTGVIGGSLLVQHNPNGGTSVVCSVNNHETK